MVQPEGIASPVTLPRYRKSRATPPQDRRQKWRKNYMMMSLPCQADDIIKMNSLKRADFHSFTQSLNRQPTAKQKHERHKKKLLRLLRQCAESIEAIASRSYVESMKSCAEFSSTDSDLSQEGQNLIVFDDTQVASPRKTYNFTRSDSKNLSEIVLRDDGGGAMYSELGSGEVLYYSTDNHSKRFVTPKLRLGGSFYSSYVEDSDFSYSQSEDDLVKQQKGGWPVTAPVLNRADRYAKLNQDDYMDLVSNGKSTAFLSEHEDDDNNLSFYYDDEFGVENSPLGAPLHDSDLEAAICNEYASLLDTANVHFNNGGGDESVNGQSNISSDFENIFPASLSSLRDESADEGCISIGEESPDLDESVPNYSDHLAPAAKEDYQITFAQAGKFPQCWLQCFMDRPGWKTSLEAK